MDYQLISIKTIDSGYAGKLSFFESERDFPFPIKRIYYIHDVPQHSQRGGHAHKALHQLLFSLNGLIEIVLDDGHAKASILLDDPGKGLIIGPGIWRNMIWHDKNAVLCVAASEYYDENDYIRNYESFLDYISSNDT